MAHDAIKIEILDDGTLKVTTDPISAPNHASAEGFLKLMAELANGGMQERTRRAEHSHGHEHHSHEHGHEHHHH